MDKFKLTLKNIYRYAILLPIAIIWDVTFWTITKIYLGAKKLNDFGEKHLFKGLD